jgi:hypothetical protein
MNTGKLVPLGDPAPNAPKWFSAVAMFRLAMDEDWLHKATRDLAKYWKHKRARRQAGPLTSPPAKRQPTRFAVEKASPGLLSQN